jgi:NAD(P)-dependent dehydrogenase (short-subunit alcohol dehydrogenase family)
MGKLLEGRVAILTGSGSSVGRYAAEAMAAEGAKVIVNSRKPGSSYDTFEGEHTEFTDEEKAKLDPFVTDAQNVADGIKSKGGKAIAVFGSVLDEGLNEKLVKTAIDNWGRVDIVVTCANSPWVGSVADMTEDKWDVQVDSKLKAQYMMIRAALPYMIEQSYGRIITCTSPAFQGLMGMCSYSAASAGIAAFTKAIAQDLSEYNITANAFAPTALARSFINLLITYKRQGIPTEIIEEGAPPAMRHLATVFAPFLAYLASEEAGSITGRHFELEADGLIGLWSEPEVVAEIRKEVGSDWTIDEIRAQIGGLLGGKEPMKTSIPLK